MFRLVMLTICCVAMVISMGDTHSRVKRLVLHSDADVADAFQEMASQFQLLNATVQDLKNTAQYKDSTIEALQTTVQVLHSAIQSKDHTLQTLNTTVHSLKATAESRESKIQSLNSTVHYLQTLAETRETTIQFLQSTVQAMQTRTLSMDTNIQSLQSYGQSMETTLQSIGTKLATGLSSTYIRWGRTVCPANGTELVYTGYVGGSYYNEAGAAADYLCLTDEPLWANYDDAAQTYGLKVYGAEYQFTEQGYSGGGDQMFGENMYEHDVPCAVCRPQRATTIMIPGRNECYPGWTLEYAGYLVAGRNGHSAASNYACLDTRPETEIGDSANLNGKLMYVTEAACGSLKCPPYVENREITCVVCSI